MVLWLDGLKSEGTRHTPKDARHTLESARHTLKCARHELDGARCTLKGARRTLEGKRAKRLTNWVFLAETLNGIGTGKLCYS